MLHTILEPALFIDREFHFKNVNGKECQDIVDIVCHQNGIQGMSRKADLVRIIRIIHNSINLN
jgi:hypothetical protein